MKKLSQLTSIYTLVVMLVSLLSAVSFDADAMKRKREGDDKKNSKRRRVQPQQNRSSSRSSEEKNSDESSDHEDTQEKSLQNISQFLKENPPKPIVPRRLLATKVTTPPFDATITPYVKITFHPTGSISGIVQISKKEKFKKAKESSPPILSQQNTSLTLSDLSSDSLTKIIQFMLCSENKSESVDVIKVLENLQSTCKAMGITISQITKQNDTIKTLIHYIHTEKKLLPQSTLYLYQKINDQITPSTFDQKRKKPFSIILKHKYCNENVARKYLVPLYRLFQLQMELANKETVKKKYIARKQDIALTLITSFAHKAMQTYHNCKTHYPQEIKYLFSPFDSLGDLLVLEAQTGNLGNIKWLVKQFDKMRLFNYSHFNAKNHFINAIKKASTRGHTKVVEYILYLPQLKIDNLIEFCKKHDIVTTIHQAGQKKYGEHLLNQLKKKFSTMNKTPLKPYRQALSDLFLIATKIGALKFLKKLAKKNKNKLQRDEITQAFGVAMENKDNQITRYLRKNFSKKILLQGGHIDVRKILSIAAQKGFLEVIRTLHEQNNFVANTILPKQGTLLLYIAAQFGNYNIVRYLVETNIVSLKTTSSHQHIASCHEVQEYKTPAAEQALLFAINGGNKTTDQKKKEEYQKIIDYLLDRNKKLADAIQFLTGSINRKPTKDNDNDDEYSRDKEN